MADPDPEQEAIETLGAVISAAIRNVPGWPLDKRETFAAFALMGLTSRLQPLQLDRADAQKTVIDLSFKLGSMAIDAAEKK